MGDVVGDTVGLSSGITSRDMDGNDAVLAVSDALEDTVRLSAGFTRQHCRRRYRARVGNSVGVTVGLFFGLTLSNMDADHVGLAVDNVGVHLYNMKREGSKKRRYMSVLRAFVVKKLTQ